MRTAVTGPWNGRKYGRGRPVAECLTYSNLKAKELKRCEVSFVAYRWRIKLKEHTFKKFTELQDTLSTRDITCLKSQTAKLINTFTHWLFFLPLILRLHLLHLTPHHMPAPPHPSPHPLSSSASFPSATSRRSMDLLPSLCLTRSQRLRLVWGRMQREMEVQTPPGNALLRTWPRPP